MLPTLALIEIRRKRLDLMKNRVFFSIWRNRKCARYLLEVTLSARAQFTLPAHFGKIKQSHTELVFLSFSYFVFACTLFTLHFAKHKEKHLKCMQICKFLSCFYFPCAGWRKWPEVKFHLLSNARERAHESVNGPLRWPNTVFACAFADAIQRAHKDCKNQTCHQ